MSVEILVNGKPEAVAPETSVAGWIASKGLHPTLVAVEVNQELVPRKERDLVVLKPGDRVELVSLVGGG